MGDTVGLPVKRRQKPCPRPQIKLVLGACEQADGLPEQLLEPQNLDVAHAELQQPRVERLEQG